ncbi:hypothetical protein GCM10010222_17840 [Streptomyces tanashiensis]|nr:hypothetical protein GCM10010222_17840 [Streptomyces tanashiensis]
MTRADVNLTPEARALGPLRPFRMRRGEVGGETPRQATAAACRVPSARPAHGQRAEKECTVVER